MAWLFFVAMMVFIICWAGIMAGWGNFWGMFDFPSLMMVALIGISTLAASGLWKDFLNAFRLAVGKRKNAGLLEWKRAKEAVELFMKAVKYGGFFIALISGALMSVQGVFNTQVTKSSSIWTASAFVQLSALAVCLGAWVCTDRSNLLEVFRVEPKYMLLGGAIGAFITYTVIKSMDMLGPARAVMLIVVAQLAVAYVIELFGWFGVEKQPWEWRKAIGMAVAVAGIVIFKWK